MIPPRSTAADSGDTLPPEPLLPGRCPRCRTPRVVIADRDATWPALRRDYGTWACCLRCGHEWPESEWTWGRPGDLPVHDAPTPGLVAAALDVRAVAYGRQEVVGTGYRAGSLLATLYREGRRFRAVLVHERRNPHDANAVMVRSAHGHLGYLPRSRATVWAPVLDRVHDAGFAGLLVDGRIEEHAHRGLRHAGEHGDCFVTLPDAGVDLLLGRSRGRTSRRRRFPGA